MLFKTRFHEGIRNGAIRVTYRAWQRPRVRAGARYSCPPIGFIEVDAIDEVPLGTIDEKDARASGFESLADLFDALHKTASKRLTKRSKVYRVRFHYCGRREPAPRASRSRASLDDLAGRLARMDRLGRRGAWTHSLLALIDAHPGVAASRLAPEVGMDKTAFKANVRKLKKLGLTESLSVGYELSPLGEALLQTLD